MQADLNLDDLLDSIAKQNENELGCIATDEKLLKHSLLHEIENQRRENDQEARLLLSMAETMPTRHVRSTRVGPQEIRAETGITRKRARNVCPNCKRSNMKTTWRYVILPGTERQRYCNACALYFKYNNRQRPVKTE
jgi:hypothetical protein